MRSVALGLLAAASLNVPGFAAEPNGPANLITPADGLRITIQGLVSAKSDADSAQRNALVEYYGAPDRNLLWVDDNGLNPRAELVMAEIAKADDYGLRASDYALPDAASFSPSDPEAKDWLADSEMKVSYAVLNYAKDARGGTSIPRSRCRILPRCSNRSPSGPTPPPICGASSPTSRNSKRCGRS